MELAVRNSLAALKKLLVLDMDDTILHGRFIRFACSQWGTEQSLADILSREDDPIVRTKQIARLMTGRTIDDIRSLVDQIPLVHDAIAVISRLRERGYIVGIISDSYDCVAQQIRIKVGADFALANVLQFSKSVATGEVQIPSFFLRTIGSLCSHAICKTHALQSIAAEYGIALGNTIAVGDDYPDRCMLTHAGIGVAFCPNHPLLRDCADTVVTERSFTPLLAVAR